MLPRFPGAYILYKGVWPSTFDVMRFDGRRYRRFGQPWPKNQQPRTTLAVALWYERDTYIWPKACVRYRPATKAGKEIRNMDTDTPTTRPDTHIADCCDCEWRLPCPDDIADAAADAHMHHAPGHHVHIYPLVGDA